MNSSQHRWAQLLSHQRLGRAKTAEFMDESTHRTAFDADYGRLVFSSPFRRLQDKTQVFPLAKSDYTRTRLTHTLEVANVGHSLGKQLGYLLRGRGELPAHLHPEDLGSLVSVACLAHDIGNPPFGHSGEASIQEWAARNEAVLAPHLNEAELLDLKRYEGNAQSFRILARLWDRERVGGAQLTLASYGALLKYPQGSLHPREKGHCARKKFNYFQADAALAEDVREGLGLAPITAGQFARHPLVYLMEAADDICYRIVDLEDAEEAGLVSRSDMAELLRPLLTEKLKAMSKEDLQQEPISKMRAYAVGTLMKAAMQVTEAHLDELREGTFSQALIDAIDEPLRAAHDALGDKVRETAYVDERVLQVEFAGFKVIGGLLDELMEALPPDLGEGAPLSASGKKLLKIFPKKYLLVRPAPDFLTFAAQADHETLVRALTPYERMMAITDYVAGMTDSYALEQYRVLRGVTLP